MPVALSSLVMPLQLLQLFNVVDKTQSGIVSRHELRRYSARRLAAGVSAIACELLWQSKAAHGSVSVGVCALMDLNRRLNLFGREGTIVEMCSLPT